MGVSESAFLEGGTRGHYVAGLMLTWQDLRWPQRGHVSQQAAAGQEPVWATSSRRTERQRPLHPSSWGAAWPPQPLREATESLGFPSTCTQTALWRNRNWPQWNIFLPCHHPPWSFCWEICEKSRIGLVKRKLKQSTFVRLASAHVPSPNTEVPTAIFEGFVHGGQKALWRSSMLLACAWFSFSLCVVEGISAGEGWIISFGIMFYDPIGPWVL